MTRRYRALRPSPARLLGVAPSVIRGLRRSAPYCGGSPRYFLNQSRVRLFAILASPAS
jgi:hypothetical protein